MNNKKSYRLLIAFFSILIFSISCSKAESESIKYFWNFHGDTMNPNYNYINKLSGEINENNLHTYPKYYRAVYKKGVLVSATEHRKNNNDFFSEMKFDRLGRVVINSTRIRNIVKICKRNYDDALQKKSVVCHNDSGDWISESLSLYLDNKISKTINYNKDHTIRSFYLWDLKNNSIKKYNQNNVLLKEIRIPN